MSSFLASNQNISPMHSMSFLQLKNNSTSYNITTIKAFNNYDYSYKNKLADSFLDSLNDNKNNYNYNYNFKTQQSNINNSTSTNIYSIRKAKIPNDKKILISYSTQKNKLNNSNNLASCLSLTQYKLNISKIKNKRHFVYKINNNNFVNNKSNNYISQLTNGNLKNNISSSKDSIHNNIVDLISLREKYDNTFFTTIGKKDKSNINQGELSKFKNDVNDLIKGYYINYILNHKKKNINEIYEKNLEKINLDKRTLNYNTKIMNFFSNDFIEYTNYLKEIIEKEITINEKLAWKVYLIRQEIYILELKIGKLLIRLDKYVDIKEVVYKLKLFHKIHQGISTQELEKINNNFYTKMQTEYEISKVKKKFFLNIRDMKLSIDVIDDGLLENDENFVRLAKNSNFEEFTQITQNFKKYIKKQLELDKEIKEYKILLKNASKENEKYISENKENFLNNCNRIKVLYPQKIQILKDKNIILKNALNSINKKTVDENYISKMKMKISNIYNILEKYNYISNEEDLLLKELNNERESDLRKIINKLTIIERKIIYIITEIKLKLSKCTIEQKKIIVKKIKNTIISNEKHRKAFLLRKQRIEADKKLYNKINKTRVFLRNKEDYYRFNNRKNKNVNK